MRQPHLAGAEVSALGVGSETVVVMLTLTALSASAAVCICFRSRGKDKDKSKGGGVNYWPGVGPYSCENSQQETAALATIPLRTYTFSELSSATNNFDNSAIVGRGGSGIVYKATLNDKSTVAVKKMIVTQERASRELENEVQVVGKIQHKNLVSMLGYCIEQNHNLLVYDYMPNGTLQEALFLPTYPHKLTWPQLSTIINDTAQALAFLHHLPGQTRVIHRDMKPHNILLDANFRGRLADFGLAKGIGVDQSHVTTRVAGTFGYLAPEYAYTYHLTDKSDVYSFGVLMLVTIARKGPMLMDGRWKGKSVVHAAFQCAQSGQIMELVSPSYEGQYDPKQVEQYMRIALHCVQAAQGERPRMYNVERMLTGRSYVPPAPTAANSNVAHEPADIQRAQLSSVSERSDDPFSRSSADMSFIVEGR